MDEDGIERHISKFPQGSGRLVESIDIYGPAPLGSCNGCLDMNSARSKVAVSGRHLRCS